MVDIRDEEDEQDAFDTLKNSSKAPNFSSTIELRKNKPIKPKTKQVKNNRFGKSNQQMQ